MASYFYQLGTLDKPSVYAIFSALGTWIEGDMCKTCGQHRSSFTEPLLVEWDPGTDQVGDFSRGGDEYLIKDSVKDFMQANGYNASFSTGIEYQKFKWTERLGGRHKRVKFPYEGPQLYWLKIIDQVEIDIQKSNIEQDTDCPTCKRTRIKVRRTELHINKKDWKGEKFFTVKQFNNSSIKFISEEARGELQQQGFTNFTAPLAGIIGD
jgi:hypothetical protein